ncbi:hypothetical protein C9374_000504 [Naegleria lovaniensis]|uniref:Uncharacterized protein n=1 Tax=Naegleria lovaniensis TaxID=51637 RepID=A0AA88GT13_NAELO|nr:uncharacterized protein C9374_000504 [Naegleria lovaniensis]KAG2388340.1 hypothetical protein C9374_000504 [Naegleria lovaniensis]
MGLWNMIKRKKKKNAEDETLVIERSVSEGNVRSFSPEKKNSFPFGFSPKKSNHHHHHHHSKHRHHHHNDHNEKAEFFADNLITAETIEDFSSSPETKQLFLKEATSTDDNILADNSIITKIVRNRTSPNSTLNSTLDHESFMRPPSPKQADTTIEENNIEHTSFEDEVCIKSTILNHKLPPNISEASENDVTDKLKTSQRKAINETEVIENRKLFADQSKSSCEVDNIKEEIIHSPTDEHSPTSPTDEMQEDLYIPEKEMESLPVQQTQASSTTADDHFLKPQEEHINSPEMCATKETLLFEEPSQSHVVQSDINTFPSQELAQLEHKEFTRFIESELLKLKDDLQTDRRIGESVNQQRVPSPLPKEKSHGNPSHPQSLTLNLDAKYKYARRALLRQYLKNRGTSTGDKIASDTINNALDLNTSLKLQRLEKENKELERLQTTRKKYAKDLVKLEKLVEIATMENEVEASQQKSHVVIVDRKKKDTKGALSKGYSDILQTKMEMMGKILVSSSDEFAEADPEILLKQINLLKSEREKFQTLVEKQKETIRFLAEDLLTDVAIDPNEKQKLVEQVISNHSVPESPCSESSPTSNSAHHDFNVALPSEDSSPPPPPPLTPLLVSLSRAHHSQPEPPSLSVEIENCNPTLKPKKKKSKKMKKKTKESSSSTTTTVMMEAPSSTSPELPKDGKRGSTSLQEKKKKRSSSPAQKQERPSSALGLSRKNTTITPPQQPEDTRKVYEHSPSSFSSANKTLRRPMSASRCSSSSVKSSSTLINAVASPNSEPLSRIAHDITQKRPSSASATHSSSSRYDKIIDRLYEGGIEKQNKSREWARTQKELKDAKEMQEMREKPQLNRRSIELVNRKYQSGDFVASSRGSTPSTDTKTITSPSMYMTISSDGVIMQTPVSIERPRSGSIEELRLLRQESMRRRTREFNIMKESLAECTFTPNIGRKSLEIASHRKAKDEQPIHNKLFEEAKEKEAQNAKVREMAKKVKDEQEVKEIRKSKTFKSAEDEKAFINRMLEAEKAKKQRIEQLRVKCFEQETFKPKTNNTQIPREGDVCEQLYKQGLEIQKRREFIRDQYEQYLENVRSMKHTTKGSTKYIEEMKEKRIFSLFNLFCIESECEESAEVEIHRLHEVIEPLLDKFGEPLSLVIPLLAERFGDDSIINYDQFRMFIESPETNLDLEDLAAQVKLLQNQLTLQLAVENQFNFKPSINSTSRKLDPYAYGCETLEDRVDNLLSFKEYRDQKIEMMRNNAIEKELEECTFKPKINK